MDGVNASTGQVNVRAAAESVLNSDPEMIRLREQIAQSQTKLDDYSNQEKELDAKEQQYKNIATLAAKKKKTNTALLIASIAGGVAANIAIGFLCLPLVPLLAVATTFGICAIAKQREKLSGALFFSTHSMVDLQKQLVEMGKQTELEGMRKLKKKESGMIKGVEDAARMAENVSEPGAAEVIDLDTFVVIDGTKLGKNPSSPGR